jgi:hypothetical protein
MIDQIDIEDFEIYSNETIDKLIWPNELESKKVKNFFVPFLKEGISSFISNVKTCLYIIKFKNYVLPITVNEREYDNAYVASNYVFVKLLKRKMKGSKCLKWLTWSLLGLDALMRIAKINKVVMVNNWFMTTSLYPKLNGEEVRLLTEALSRIFKDHTIMWRSINDNTGKCLQDALAKNKYHLIQSREVFFFDPTDLGQLNERAKRHLRQDRQLLEKSGYRVVLGHQLEKEDFKRLIELYEMLYIERYYNGSPVFTEKFLINLLRVPDIKFVCLKKERIDGFCVLFKGCEEMSMAFLGHDTSLDIDVGIYRMLNILAIQESETLKITFNMSSGADNFKMWRGARRKKEFVAVYDKHLPLSRKLFFKTSASAVKLLNS